MGKKFAVITLMWCSVLCLISGCGRTPAENKTNEEESIHHGGKQTTAEESENETALWELPTVEGRPADVFESELEAALMESPSANTPGAILDEVLLSLADIQEVEHKADTLRYIVTAPDMAAIIGSGTNDLLQYEDGIEKIISILRSGNYPKRTVEVVVKVSSTGLPEDPYELYDAIYGGLLTVLDEHMHEWEAGQ